MDLPIDPPSIFILDNSPHPSTIRVPYQWQRLITGPDSNIPGQVLYISPSGHVLSSNSDVVAYFSEQHTCKCYLSNGMMLSDVFDFNPEAVVIEENVKGTDVMDDCDQWGAHWNDEDWPEVTFDPWVQLKESVETDLWKMYEHQVQSMKEQQNIFDDKDVIAFADWFRSFDWHRYLVTKEGHKFVHIMSPSQLKHFACEVANFDLQSALAVAVEEIVVTECGQLAREVRQAGRIKQKHITNVVTSTRRSQRLNGLKEMKEVSGKPDSLRSGSRSNRNRAKK